MGADLISYIVFGPEKLNDAQSLREQVIAAVTNYVAACREWAERVAMGETPDLPVSLGGSEAKRSITLRLDAGEPGPLEEGQWTGTLEALRDAEEYHDILRQVFSAADDYLPGMICYYTYTRADVESLVNDLFRVWHVGARDVSSRACPYREGRRVVVAGELSWGDEPRGYGYQTFKATFTLGIAQAYGLE